MNIDSNESFQIKIILQIEYDNKKENMSLSKTEPSLETKIKDWNYFISINIHNRDVIHIT